MQRVSGAAADSGRAEGAAENPETAPEPPGGSSQTNPIGQENQQMFLHFLCYHCVTIFVPYLLCMDALKPLPCTFL